MKIALDAMGGDFAPQHPVAGALEALDAFADIERLYLVGNRDTLRDEVLRHGPIPDRIEIVHSGQVVEMGDHAIDAIRRKSDSSITRSVAMVKDGLADAAVSAGHTGAAVAASIFRLRCIPGVERPGIATVLPNENKRFVLIDAGANVDAKPIHLAHYAVMGAAYCEKVLGIPNPTVGLMSIGTEATKGNDLVKDAFKLLHRLPIQFKGNVEGHDLFEHPPDVVVTDGFTGNVVLKTSESIATAIFRWLRHELERTTLRRMGALMARDAFREIKRRTDPDEIGGSPLLGVNGICIIAHGASSPRAIRNALRAAKDSVIGSLNPHILAGIERANTLIRTQGQAA